MNEELLPNSQNKSDERFCLWILIAGGVITLSALPFSWFDKTIVDYFVQMGENSLSSFMRIVTEAGAGVVLGAIALLVFTAFRDRRAGTRVALSLLLATIFVSVLKRIINRERPELGQFDSFPSGHTASAFAVAGPLLIYLRRHGAAFIAIAAFIGFSRLFRNSHHLSDVIAGAGLGLICSAAAGLMIKRAPRFSRLAGVRIAAGFLAFGFAAFAWSTTKGPLKQAVLIILPPLAFFALWSYLGALTTWFKRIVETVDEKRLLAAVFLVAFVLLVAGTWASTLFDRDEGWYAETAREMATSGNYLTPAYRGEPFLEKPPLPYWLMAGSIRLFGVNAFAARFPSVLAGAASCVMLYLIARAMFDRKTALASVVVYGTSFLTLLILRAALMDSVLILLLFVSFYGLWCIISGDKSRLAWLMLYGAAGLTFLTKYMAGVAIIGVAALATIAFTRKWEILKKARIPTGAVLFAAIVAAWFVPAYVATDGEVLSVFWEHNFGRAASAMQGHSGPFFYYIVLLPVIFFPWFAFLPAALSRRKQDAPPHSERWWFQVSWAGGTLLLFSIVSTKLPHYVFPALPALSILTGSMLCNAEARKRALAGWKAPFACFFLGLVGLVLAVGLPVALEKGEFYNLWRFFTPACSMLFVFTVLGIIDVCRRQTSRAAITLASGMTAFMLLFALVSLPSMNWVKLTEPMGRVIAEKSRPEDTVIHWGYVPPTLVFYAQRDFTESRSLPQLEKQLEEAKRAFCVLPYTVSVNLRKRTGSRYCIKKLFPKEPLKRRRGFDTGRGKWEYWTLLRVEPAIPEKSR
jgi:4-amino-4-deoxy-L-arabinose transferase-like glycosyltransferase/membrane-associated phospholipid phosphatase